MRLKYAESVVLFVINLYVVLGRKCNSSDLVLVHCSEFETCMNKTRLCECLPSFRRVNGKCVNTTRTLIPTESPAALVHETGDSNVVAAILIPIFLIMLVICGVYVSRKYRLVSWVHSKLNQRNSNYDEVMIGQDDDDDPPLQD